MDILFEDNHLIVAVKPQNIPTQGDESGDQNMLDMVKDYVKQKYNKPGEAFVGLVHRLDRPTGGVMVFAKTSKAASRLAEQMKEGDFEKRYYAVVQGVPPSKHSRLVNYLYKDEVNNIVTVVGEAVTGAKRAELEYRMVDEVAKYSLVDIKLLTGRAHQARVQMKHMGCPIVGDVKYGAENIGCNLALWAFELKLLHPITQIRMAFRAMPPISDIPWSKLKLLENHFNRL